MRGYRRSQVILLTKNNMKITIAIPPAHMRPFCHHGSRLSLTSVLVYVTLLVFQTTFSRSVTATVSAFRICCGMFSMEWKSVGHSSCQWMLAVDRASEVDSSDMVSRVWRSFLSAGTSTVTVTGTWTIRSLYSTRTESSTCSFSDTPVRHVLHPHIARHSPQTAANSTTAPAVLSSPFSIRPSSS